MLAQQSHYDIEINEADPLDDQNWHVWVDGDQVGPVSVRQIARGIRAGKVPTHARVQQAGDVWWSGVMNEPNVMRALEAD